MSYEFSPLEIVSMAAFGIMYILNTKQDRLIRLQHSILGDLADKKAEIFRSPRGTFFIRILNNEH